MSDSSIATYTEGKGIEAYFQSVWALEQDVIARQKPLLVKIAAAMADCIRHGRRIFIFGTGHSHMLAEEGFYRAGGLAAVVPIISTALMVHENPTLSSKLERTPGLAATVLDEYQPYQDEMIFVVSNSGVNTLPVEMALVARERGLVVVTLSSFEYCRVAPLSPHGKRLNEVADYALDNGCPAGDALVALPDQAWRAGAASTVMTALLWNCLVAETALHLEATGHTAPVFVSLNLAGADEHNARLLESWQAGNPHF
jgi:uncharacterized phosphosugar-binding protein